MVTRCLLGVKYASRLSGAERWSLGNLRCSSIWLNYYLESSLIELTELLPREWLGFRDMVQSATHAQVVHLARVIWQLLAAIEEVVREANREGNRTLDLINILIRELQVQSLDVALEVLESPATNDGKHVGCLAGHVGLRHAGDERVLALGNGLESLADLDVGLARGDGTALLLALLVCLDLVVLFLRLELTAAERAPGRQALYTLELVMVWD